MAEFPALPLWTDAYLADCEHLSEVEHGRYLLLLIAMWRNSNCKVPNDDQWLARKFKKTAEEVEKDLRPIIKEFCRTSKYWIWQPRLTRERAFVLDRSKKQADRANQRWNKEKDTSHGNADAGNAAAGIAPTPTPTPTPTKNKIDSPQSVTSSPRTPAKTGTRWPPNQPVPRDWLRIGYEARAAANLPPTDIALAATEFTNHWTAASGRAATKLDWLATWRNWCTSPHRPPLKPNGHPNGHAKTSAHSRFLNAAASVINDIETAAAKERAAKSLPDHSNPQPPRDPLLPR